MRIATGVLIVIGELMSANATPAPPNGISSSIPSPACPAYGCGDFHARVGILEDHTTTSRYKIDINYSGFTDADSHLRDRLDALSNRAKHEFVQSLPDPKQFPEFADRKMQLLIDFKVAARTQDFVSVRETGMQDTGGAHPIPIDSTIVYDTQAHRTIGLDDLFAKPDAARKALADYARARLTNKIMAQAPKSGEGSPEAIADWKTNAQKMIDDGTQPTEENFANFIVRPDSSAPRPSPGLALIFPPYQVAAYVYGTQTVDIPAEVFMQELKPQYREAFIRK